MRFLCAVYCLLLIAACSGKKVPKGILEPEKMQEVMWDMIRAGEFLNGYVLYRDTFTNNVAESQRWYNKVYELHNVTKEEFVRSYAYYKDHPALIRPIFAAMEKYEAVSKEPEGVYLLDTTGTDSMQVLKDSVTTNSSEEQMPADENGKPVPTDIEVKKLRSGETAVPLLDSIIKRKALLKKSLNKADTLKAL